MDETECSYEQSYDGRRGALTERVEVRSRLERRRRWSSAAKLAIVRETLVAGSTAQVVADHGCPVVAWTQPAPELWLDRMFSQLTGWPLQVTPYTVTDVLGGTGLGAGEEVVVAGGHVLSPGQKVVRFEMAQTR